MMRWCTTIYKDCTLPGGKIEKTSHHLVVDSGTLFEEDIDYTLVTIEKENGYWILSEVYKDQILFKICNRIHPQIKYASLPEAKKEVEKRVLKFKELLTKD